MSSILFIYTSFSRLVLISAFCSTSICFLHPFRKTTSVASSLICDEIIQHTLLCKLTTILIFFITVFPHLFLDTFSLWENIIYYAILSHFLSSVETVFTGVWHLLSIPWFILIDGENIHLSRSSIKTRCHLHIKHVPGKSFSSFTITSLQGWEQASLFHTLFFKSVSSSTF